MGGAATGVLTAADPDGAAHAADLRVWPPQGAVPLPADGFYERLTERGFGYGPVFQGLRAAWRRDGELFAEVALPDSALDDAAAFGLHRRCWTPPCTSASWRSRRARRALRSPSPGAVSGSTPPVPPYCACGSRRTEAPSRSPTPRGSRGRRTEHHRPPRLGGPARGRIR
ncbi:polyketide synthase dehydratase domain-containing protein [Streptomyces parvulus]|nr:polyketide synthase dehydratase domain-containing protein [Streptomyces parvulus]